MFQPIFACYIPMKTVLGGQMGWSVKTTSPSHFLSYTRKRSSLLIRYDTIVQLYRSLVIFNFISF